MERRLPVYLLIDCSGSMIGDPINAVWDGVETLWNTLLGTPTAVDAAYLSVITFADQALETAPLTKLTSFQPPRVEAGGFTAMGAALNLLADCVDRDVQRKSSQTERGDYRPLVFLFTDGNPTDDEPKYTTFRDAVQRVRAMRWGQFVACAGGRNVNTQKLMEITDNVVQMTELTPPLLATFFQMVSDSIGSSIQLNTPVGLPATLPAGYVDLRKPPRQTQSQAPIQAQSQSQPQAQSQIPFQTLPQSQIPFQTQALNQTQV